jgi:hypothetical protein
VGPVELLHHQSPIPSEKGIRLGNARDILHSLAPESFGDLGQGGSLRQAEPRRQVNSEDAILGRQVFIAQQQFLADEAATQRPEGVPTGIDRAWENVHDGRTHMLRSGPRSREYFDHTGIRSAPASRPALTIFCKPDLTCSSGFASNSASSRPASGADQEIPDGAEFRFIRIVLSVGRAPQRLAKS